MAHSDHMPPMNRFVAFLAGVALFLIFGVLAMLALVVDGGPVNEVEKQRAEDRIAARQNVEATSAEVMNRSEVIDEEAGLVRIPVDDYISIAASKLTDESMRARKLEDESFVVPGSPTHQRLRDANDNGEEEDAEDGDDNDEEDTDEPAEEDEGDEGAGEAQADL